MIDKLIHFFRRKKNVEKTEPVTEKKKTKSGSVDLPKKPKDPRFKLIEKYYQLANEIKRPTVPLNVVPESAKTDQVYMATDSAINEVIDYAQQTCKCSGFVGYPFLAELLQYSEYRSPSETTSKEMVRKWVTVKQSGDDGQKTNKVYEINKALKQFKIKKLFERCAELDGQFGSSFLFVDIKNNDKKDEPLIIDSSTITQGSLKGFKVIEPMWCYPYKYNSTDPLSDYYYKPEMWFVSMNKVHSTRLLQFVSREVPDLLKPVFNFGGISMTQLMVHYVERWYRTTNSISDLISSFVVKGVKTKLSDFLDDVSNVSDLTTRADVFVGLQDNQGLMLLDKEEEEFFQFTASLSGLHELQAQAQEQMAAPTHTPLVKLTGITPSGLNANSDGEIQVYYDYISSMQETLFRDNLKKVIDIIQLHLFGEIDESIDFDFNPLKESTDLELAQIRKSDAETDAVLVTNGIVSALEVRSKLANDKESDYSGIKADDVPEIPSMFDTGYNYEEEENAA